jgi:hypothetical protein
MGSPGMGRGKRFAPSDSMAYDARAPRPGWLDNPTQAKRTGELPLTPPTKSGRPYDAGGKR